MPYGSNAEFFQSLKALIEGWCDRRLLSPLSRILGPYLGFNGLTDGWAELAAGLKGVRAQDRDELTVEEQAIVDDLIRATDKTLQGS